MFVDEAAIHIKAGDGGHGCVSFRREKFIPKGGPDGGDGGSGGSVIFRADSSKDTLLDFSGRHHWNAPKGQPGMGKKMAGLSGADLIVEVPPGTLIYDADHDLLLADLDAVGKQVTIARGGKGGRGNWHFRSPTNQAPRYAEPGDEGQQRSLKLELKLIADIGLVGLPNAGKSTLLRSISAARPKVADYPFTTLDPQLGIVELPGYRRMVVADLPGLIAGAQHGAGLGHAFLRHIERTKVIVHLIDMYPMDGSDPAENYRVIRRELEAFSPALANQREVIAANKMDLAIDDEALDHLMAELPDKEIFAVSGASHQGVDSLLETLWKILRQDKPAEPAAEPGREGAGGLNLKSEILEWETDSMSWPDSLQIALKEWASVCRSLETGRQMILLRKGGIYESAGEFELENRQFLLFPTYLHQNLAMLKPEAHGGFSPAGAEPSEVIIPAAAHVSDIIELKSRHQMDALEQEHVWTKPLIDMRFNYKPANPLYLLLVRAYRLAEPVAVQNTPAYAGCKSWVPLDEPVKTAAAAAVLDDPTYAARRKSILDAIAQS